MAKAFDVNASGTLTTSLLAWYNCEEASGNLLDEFSTNDLTITGSVSSQTGKIGTARGGFPTVNTNYFSTASILSVSSTVAYSLSFWIYRNAAITTDQEAGPSVGGGSSGTYGLRTGFSGNNKLSFTSSKDQIAGTASVADTVDMTLQTWTHCVVTHTTGGVVTLYKNGSSLGSATESPADASASTKFTVGGYYYGSGPTPKNVDAPDVYVDLIGYWSKVVSAQEITDLYNGGTGNAYRTVAIVASNNMFQGANF